MMREVLPGDFFLGYTQEEHQRPADCSLVSPQIRLQPLTDLTRCDPGRQFNR